MSKKKAIILVLVVLLIGVGIAGYFYYFRTPMPPPADLSNADVDAYVDSELPEDASDELKADRLRLLASLSEQNEDYEKAIEYYEEIESDFELTDADKFNLAQLYKAEGNTKKYEQYLKESGISESEVESEKKPEEGIECSEEDTECVQ